MMKNLSLIGLCLSALSLFSCSQIEEKEMYGTEHQGKALMTKVVNSEAEALQGRLLVKFSSVPSESDLEEIKAKGYTEIERIFNSVKGKEELEKRFGLDRWYVVRFDDDCQLDEAAATLAQIRSIQTVEFEKRAGIESDGNVYPYNGPETATRGISSDTEKYPFNDPSLPDQWHYINYGSGSVATNVDTRADINVKSTWERITCGDPDIVVAVVDYGVKHTHPDLTGNMWTNEDEIPGNGVDDDGNGYVDDVYGYNFVDNGSVSWGKSNDSSHGTHIAGTIAAVNNNKTGVSGIAGGSGKNDGCRIMSCQIFSNGRGGTATQTAKAIKYAGDNGASIISCSYGYDVSFTSDNNYFYSIGTLESDAIKYFEACRNNDVLDGGIAIFASGNDSHNFAHYPGAIYDIISVSAFGPDFLPTYYTNYGPGCNITAPGGEAGLPPYTSSKALILSTLVSELGGAEYGYMQGTSMACPHVSGVVALALSYAKEKGKKFTVDEFKNMILSSTNDIDTKISKGKKEHVSYASVGNYTLSNYYHKMGTGAIDTWRLMMYIDGIPCSTATLGESQWINLDPYYGSSSVSLSYLDVEVPQSTIDALGLQKIKGASDSKNPAVPEEGYAIVQFGRLYIHPTKIGNGKLTIKAVGGGNMIGGGNNPPGGMELSQEVSIIVRDTDGGNGTGGWL